MQIHELNPFQGTLGSEAFLVVDNGDDTGKISVERLTQPINDRIDDIITSPAPTEQEIIDARRGWNEVVYGSLGTAIRSQVKQILAQFYKFNTYDLLAVYGTPISRTRNGVTFTWDDAGQVCEVSGEAVGGDAYASIYTQTGAWPGIFEHGVVYTIGYETTDPNVKLRIAVWEGVETTPDYYYFDENGYFGIPPEAAKISIDLWVASGDTVSAVVKNVYMLRTYTAKEVTATIRDAMIGADRHMYNSLGDAIREQLNGKVDKVTGKGLSTNDFTDEDKTKLDDVEAGAEVNAIEAIKLDGTELTPDENKAVDIPVDDTLTEAGTPAEAKAVGDELEKKANSDGYYETFTSGQTEQIIATEAITDTEPYIYRKTGGPNDVGDRVYDEIVGGSVAWNQLAKCDRPTETLSGITFTNNGDGSITFNGTATARGSRNVDVYATSTPIGHVFFASGYKKVGTNQGYLGFAGVAIDRGVGGVWKNTTEYTSLSLRVDYYEGDTFNDVKMYPIVIDLTAAVTPTIADYIYTLETANAGDGVAWVKKYLPGVIYRFSEPTFQHVQTNAKETIGFNQINPAGYITLKNNWYNRPVGSTLGVGTISASVTGENPIKITFNSTWNAVGFLSEPLISGQTYYYKFDVPNNSNGRIQLYLVDDDMNILYRGWTSSTATSRTGTYEITPERAGKRWLVCFGCGDTATTLEISNLSWNITGDRDGEYKPYQKRTYPLDALTLRGIPKLDSANRMYFYGDIYRHDGTVERRVAYSEFDGSQDEPWSLIGSAARNIFRISTLVPNKAGVDFITNGMTVSATSESASADDNIITCRTTSYISSYLYVFAPPSMIADISAFRSWLASHPLEMVYPINEPTTETAEPYQYPMVVDPLGTERFIDYAFEQGDRDVEIPVGHTSDYPPNLRDKLQNLPSLSSDGDGRYIIVQTGNQMVLSPDTSAGLIAALEARVAALEGGN